MELIGITGRAGSGKDWLGREVLRPAGWVQWAFAWPMKMDLIGRGEMTYAEAFVTKPPAVRDRMQQYGTTDMRGVYGDDVWLREADGWLRLLADTGAAKVYVSDVRFPNEFDFIRARGGKLVRMLHGMGRPYALQDTPMAAHATETAGLAEPVDVEVLNGRWLTPELARRDLRMAGVL